MSVFSVSEQPLTMTGGGPNGASLSLGLTNYFYAFCSKHIMGGLNMSGIKG